MLIHIFYLHCRIHKVGESEPKQGGSSNIDLRLGIRGLSRVAGLSSAGIGAGVVASVGLSKDGALHLFLYTEHNVNVSQKTSWFMSFRCI